MRHNSATSTTVENTPLTAGCDAASWSPEVISLYGDAETILAKIKNFELEFDSRRVFILSVETKEHAEIGFYEKSGPGKLTVKKWRGSSYEDISSKIDNAILENQGVHCVGEQSKAIVDILPNLREDTDIPIPVNSTAAFSHAIRAVQGEFARAKIYLMC